ncbi:MAG: hypothetical protein IPL71_21650 [Anaerolineales bacterium]|uniref:hypothetical protein n=1 Tax=Candidatus Villigracilis proximus TaxID=3140683 RepID=UPI0031376C01|nr:hypothetical protein [Anaerolineales bacterium]
MKKTSSLSLLKVIVSTMVLFLWNLVGNKFSEDLSLSKSSLMIVGMVLFVMIVWMEMDFQMPKISSGFAKNTKTLIKYSLIAITVIVSAINLYTLKYGISNIGFILSSVVLYSIFGIFMVNAGLQLLKYSDTARWISTWYLF